MDMRLRHPFAWAVFSGILASSSVSPLRANLAVQSPFLPRSAGAAQAVPSKGVELRGIMSTPDGTAFCIYDPGTKTSEWVGLNEAGFAFIVRSADIANEAVVVGYQGEDMRLVLRNSRVVSSGPVPQGGYPEAAADGSSEPASASPDATEQNRKLKTAYAKFHQRTLEREKARRDLQNSKAIANDDTADALGRQP